MRPRSPGLRARQTGLDCLETWAGFLARLLCRCQPAELSGPVKTLVSARKSCRGHHCRCSSAWRFEVASFQTRPRIPEWQRGCPEIDSEQMPTECSRLPWAE
eukprot:scaffold102144_cov24-Tisochrysis_lutea.AAC.3